MTAVVLRNMGNGRVLIHKQVWYREKRLLLTNYYINKNGSYSTVSNIAFKSKSLNKYCPVRAEVL
jgi:hypothetical protein